MTTSLAELDVLALDCQATSGSASDGHLLEVGWSAVRAGDVGGAVESRVLALPEGALVSDRVRRVTGITEAELEAGIPVASAWSELSAAARSLGRDGPCPTVIHFSRFEEPFLRRLHQNESEPFPFRIFCTHEIARRLLPELPRRGLRALAGYFGHAVPETRRAAHHVTATVAVWRETLAVLEREHDIHTLEDLETWLKTPVRTGQRRSYPMSPTKLAGLPDEPGVYRMTRQNGDVLYVGKATSLTQRVRTYFQKSTRHPEHILEMLSQAVDIELTVTGSAAEAALEETDQIKAYAPPYNKALREADRTLVFADASLTRFSDGSDRKHRCGPLPSSPMLLALAAAASGEAPSSPNGALAIPERYGPTEETLGKGLALFRERLGARSLAALGASLWLDRQQAEDEPPELTLKLQYDEGVERWSPESVASRLEEMTLRAAHLVRRGAWLSVLSESSLEWDRGVLEIEHGRVRRRGSEHRSRGARPSFQERRHRFDIATYDRMAVLLKEIRRLVASQRSVILHVDACHSLDAERLAQVLRWI